MPTYKNIDSFFDEKGPEDIERFVDKNLDISQQVYAILKEKGWSQKDFAQELGKSDAEVSKWLRGTHNLTLRSITKMEAVLGRDIILTPMKAKEMMGEKIKYVAIGTPARTNREPFSDESVPSVYAGSSHAPKPNYYNRIPQSNQHLTVLNEPEPEGYYTKEPLNLTAA